MDRIIITEEDLTTNIESLDSTDVVYVPGFSIAIPGAISGAYTVPEAFEPTLCTSVAQFEACFGSTPAIFAENQDYPVRDAAIRESSGFLPKAIPEAEGGRENTWFNASEPDPSYIYAKELLISGIPVVYERVNGIGRFSAEATSGQNTVTLDYTPIFVSVVVNDKELREGASDGFSVSGKIITFANALVEGDKIFIKYSTVEDIKVEKMYEALANVLFNTTDDEACKIVNKDYQIKYITSGGYPTYEYNYAGADNYIVNQMIQVARLRGDAIALIDHTDNPTRPLIGVDSVFNKVNGELKLVTTNDADTYAAMITPWGNYSLNGNYTYTDGRNSTSKSIAVSDQNFGGSFAYLTCLAKSLKSNPNWLAIAGATRGLVPNLRSLRVNKMLTNAIANNYQPENGVCINGITNIKPYGFCIWGNRTLRDQSSASRKGYAIGFLNLRNLVSDVKKQAHLAAQSLMFEQNTDVLWINFKSLMTPLLDRMVSGSGLSNYKLVKVPSDSKTKLKVLIKIYPIYAIEQFEIAVQITDEEVTVQ